MVSQADRELINNFVIELRPYLEQIEAGVYEFGQPHHDGVVVGQAVQALMMVRGAGQILMVDGLVSISSWLVESFEKIQNNPSIAPAEATRRLMGLYNAMDDYLTGLDRGDDVDAIVLRAKTIFEAIPSFAGPLPGTGKLRQRTDLDALFGEDERFAPTRRISSDAADTDKLAAAAALSANDPTAELPEARPTVPLQTQSSEHVTQPVSEQVTQRTREAPARIVPIPPQPTEKLPKVDPELREIFEEEALEIIAAFGDSIRELARNPIDRASIHSLNRAAHTLKGAANMTGFPLIAQIGAAIELLFDEQIERDQPVGRDVLELVAVSWKMLRAMVPNLNNLSSFTSPSNSIVQRASVLREQLARAHADAETIPMDERHYGTRPTITRTVDAADELVTEQVQAPSPIDQLPEVDAVLVESAPTVPLRRDPVEPAVEEEPADVVVTPEAEIFQPAPTANVAGDDAAPTDELVDPITVDVVQQVNEDIEIVAESTSDTATVTPFWSEPEPVDDPLEADVIEVTEPTVEADVEPSDKPQSEPFWTSGTEESMRSAVGTDMLLADIQGLDDLEAEIAEAAAAATASGDFFTGVNSDTSEEFEDALPDDASWLDESERPQTDLLNFDANPRTQPFWDRLDDIQVKPFAASDTEVEEPITMDPFFEPVNLDTSFLHQADPTPESATVIESDSLPEEPVDMAPIDAEIEQDVVVEGQPWVTSEHPDTTEASEYTYSYAFDFDDVDDQDAAPANDFVTDEPVERIASEESDPDDTIEAGVDSVEDLDSLRDTEEIVRPAFISDVAESMASATLEPVDYLPAYLVGTTAPVAGVVEPDEEAPTTSGIVWSEIEDVVPTHHYADSDETEIYQLDAMFSETDELDAFTAVPLDEPGSAEDDFINLESAVGEPETTEDIVVTSAAEVEYDDSEDFWTPAADEHDVAIDSGQNLLLEADVFAEEVEEFRPETDTAEDIVIEAFDVEPAESTGDAEGLDRDIIFEVAEDAPLDAEVTEDIVVETSDAPAEDAQFEATGEVDTDEPADDDVRVGGVETIDSPAEPSDDRIVEAAITTPETNEIEATDDTLLVDTSDSSLAELDDVVASLESDGILVDLAWFEHPEDEAEEGIEDSLELESIEVEPIVPGTGRIAEPGTGSLGRSTTDTLGFGSLDLDRFLTTEGSVALSSALLDMAVTAPVESIGSNDSLGSESISVFDENSDRALEIEMFETFALEAEDHIANLNRAAMHLDRDPLATEPIIDIKRALHTIKGAAAAADFMEISDLAHRLEDSLATHERLGSLSDRTFAGELFTAMEEVEARLSRRKDELFGISDDEQSGGTLRIDVGRVDDLLNTVGELVVNRSSFEERLERLATTLEDLSTAATRLQRSSYLLEREANSEDAIGRLLRGELHGRKIGMTLNDVQSDWDMLEMDRYTEFDRLIRQLAEVGADVTTAVGEINALHGDFDTISTRQRRLTTALQDELMGVRMVPISSLAPRLYRVVRRAASRRGKEVSLIIEGGETPFDKLLLDTLSESLLHLLRNSVDHGIEDAAERRRLGKPEHGSIRIRAFRDGSEAVIEIIDDGAGIDHEALIQLARDKGISIPEYMSREEALLLIFEPGFTTRDEVDDISGRGLGLEIVEQTISRYKGRVAVDSVVGRGTVISLRLPVMLSVIQAFLVGAGDGEFAIPVANVDYVVDRIDQPLTQIGNSIVIETANQIIPVVDVSARIGRSRTPVMEKTSGWIMVTEMDGKRWALVVDELHGQQEIVVKPMGRFLRATPGLMGATILGRGDVALIIDVPALLGVDSLVTRLNSAPTTETKKQLGRPRGADNRPSKDRPAHIVLVVDDSLSVRRVVSRTIERNGWVAILARDGMEALELLEQGQADIILTDIEMPRMDGFELISALRGRSAYEDIPIVVLTSRSGDKHRERALSLGANEYLVKPFQEQELVEVVEHMSRASSKV